MWNLVKSGPLSRTLGDQIFNKVATRRAGEAIREASAKSARTHLHHWPRAVIDIDRLVDDPSVDFGFALRAFGVEDVAQALDRAR